MRQVAAQVGATIGELGDVRRRLDAALGSAERAGQGFASVGRATAADQLPDAVATCGEVAERLVAEMAALDRPRERLWTYLRAVAPGMAGPEPTAAPATTVSAGLRRQDQARAQPGGQRSSTAGDAIDGVVTPFDPPRCRRSFGRWRRGCLGVAGRTRGPMVT